jgi:FtsP/CotA-like multicopper oxidase with cupredoxin domain
MRKMKLYRMLPAAALFLAACGGGDAPDTGSTDSAPAAAPAAPVGPVAPTGAMTIPEWFVVDNAAQTVTLDIVAGAVADNNYWNYNGYIRGQIAINVPEGYAVTINLENRDPNMAHSLGISSELTNFMTPPTPDPVFAGAITENPQSMIEATMPGETESITFVADAAGNYTMICYIAGHSAIGMWLFFNVTDGGVGVQGL